ncbi:hypothetical protein CCMA1212_002167 [Trichoderma ghanense]|uniref:Uncharacterized protein n=1 Tax=Trichoderma ghanense TaxID=65468 RepID=A0ABY2HGS0_9HYPO
MALQHSEVSSIVALLSNLCLFLSNFSLTFRIVIFPFFFFFFPSCSGWASNLGLETFGVRSVYCQRQRRGMTGHGKCKTGRKGIGRADGHGPGSFLTMDESQNVQNAEQQANEQEGLLLLRRPLFFFSFFQPFEFAEAVRRKKTVVTIGTYFNV